MPRTYLITGGAGFIGSHLAEELLDRGERVVVLDVDELVHRCEVVVHLAAAVGVKLIVEQPLRSFTTNIRGSEIVVGAAHRYRCKILVASTSEIYGKNG